MIAVQMSSELSGKWMHLVISMPHTVMSDLLLYIRVYLYVGESNENRKTEIKIRNIAPLPSKLADMLPVL
jgi:hypothetical protein